MHDGCAWRPSPKSIIATFRVRHNESGMSIFHPFRTSNLQCWSSMVRRLVSRKLAGSRYCFCGESPTEIEAFAGEFQFDVAMTCT